VRIERPWRRMCPSVDAFEHVICINPVMRLMVTIPLTRSEVILSQATDKVDGIAGRLQPLPEPVPIGRLPLLMGDGVAEGHDPDRLRSARPLRKRGTMLRLTRDRAARCRTVAGRSRRIPGP
jgi:hypothetical protein